ncbi:hypothetical protein DA2_1212 [Desulfovibrio sp. A2]|nr:hypothetical protein DA2_1212 [Desulfovibrio sp. A2]
MTSQRLRDAREAVGFLERQRSPWDEAWRDIAVYVLPRRGRMHGRDPLRAPASDQQDARGGRVIDATATRAVRILAAGMQGGLTSPARPWFRLRLADGADAESGPARRWLDAVEQRLYWALARSNFYQASHALYTELAAFGSADLYQEVDPERLTRFAALTCGEFSWACNAAGRVDTVVRRMLMTARQLAERYGEARLSTGTRRMLRNEPNRHVEVVHLVRPRAVRSPGRDGNLHMPFESLVFEADGAAGDLLHEGGFEEFPHLTARWDVTGSDVYGRSPGMDVLPDVKMLQEMARSQLLAIHKVVNPPMRVPTGFKQRLNLIPGAQNYVAPGQPEAVAPLYQINPDIAAVTRKIEDVRKAVREGFFNDLFLMFTGDGRSNVTAAEVAERGQEKLLMLGPVIERHQTELLDPLLTRTYGILRRAGALPPNPPELEGLEMRVEYVSALAQAQRMGAAQSIRQFAAEVTALSATAPGVLDKIDFEQAVDELASIGGVPAKVVRSDAEVARLRAAREAGQVAGMARSAAGAVQALAKALGAGSAGGGDGEVGGGGASETLAASSSSGLPAAPTHSADARTPTAGGGRGSEARA